MSESVPQRRRPIHLPLREQTNRSAIVFLTVCTDRRRALLAQSDVLATVQQAWQRADAWIVGRFVLMPDHLHLFCAPARVHSTSLVQWVKFWKTEASRHWPRPSEHPIWQQGFWDRQLRNHEHYSQRWDYVRNNPVRHGLVGNADAWPFRGEMTELRFHSDG